MTSTGTILTYVQYYIKYTLSSFPYVVSVPMADKDGHGAAYVRTYV